jgi:hypothetical protein
MRCHSLAWFRVVQSSKTPWGYREDIETMTLYVVIFSNVKSQLMGAHWWLEICIQICRGRRVEDLGTRTTRGRVYINSLRLCE